MASVKSKVPKLRFKGFSGEWNITKLCDISDKVQEKNKNNLINETFTNSAEYGIINQRDFFNKDISNEINLCHYYVVQPNDFVYNPRISNLAPVGPIKRNKLNRTGVMSPLYYVFRTHSINNDFLDYYFSTSKWHRFMFMNGDKGARSDRFAIGDSVFRTMPILTPKQQEQTQIGHFFQKLDQVIERQQHALTQAQNYKKAMLQKMFPQKGEKVPKVRFKGFSGDWEVHQANKIFLPISDKNHPNLPVLSATQDKGMVRRDEVGIDIKFEKSTLNSYKRILPDQFIIHLRSFQGGFAHSNIEGIASPAYTIIDFKNKSQCYSLYWKYFFTSGNFIRRLESITYGIRDGRSISFSDFSIMRFMVPSLKEQTQIGNFFQQLDKQITEQQNKLTHYQTLKKAMLQRLFI